MLHKNKDRFIVRLPDGWRDVIKSEAAKAHRSMNAEIIAAIEQGMLAKGVALELPTKK
ncbi:Arc family DNA-binding protein [Marinovum algicola]|uniref:Arc family DNA-binding protein n=1 Tax=Marinovum algicola TaxID=42444 RepID=UPI003B51E491